jgi:hypothetical protein
MPTVLKIGSFRFHFYSDEGGEPPHIHVAIPEGECKFWLDPISLARNKGIDPKTVRRIEKMVFEHYVLLKEKYNDIHRS